MLCPTNLSKAVEDGQAQPSSTRSLGGISSSLPALSVVSQRSEWCSVPPTCQSSWRLSRLVPQRSDWNHLSHADRWSWLRPKYLGQWYTIVQTFWPFGYDIFKIPKCQNQLYFWFKIARVAWYHVSHGGTWFQTLGASLKHFWSFPRVLATEAEVSWSTVYYISDFSAIWICHLFWSSRKHFFWISEPGKHI